MEVDAASEGLHVVNGVQVVATSVILVLGDCATNVGNRDILHGIVRSLIGAISPMPHLVITVVVLRSHIQRSGVVGHITVESLTLPIYHGVSLTKVTVGFLIQVPVSI